MDLATVKAKAEALVTSILSNPDVNQRGFTSLDITRPIAEEDSALHSGFRTVRHSDVRNVLHEMYDTGRMVCAGDGVYQGNAAVRTSISVQLAHGQSTRTFLYHDPDYDPDTYTARNQVLPPYRDDHASLLQVPSSPSPAPSSTRALLDMDDDASAAIPAQVATVTGVHPVTRQCQVQQANETINIPSPLVKTAGFNPGDRFAVETVAGVINIRRMVNGVQQVDAEGRIRIHGRNVQTLNRRNGETCTVLLVTPENGDPAYLSVQ